MTRKPVRVAFLLLLPSLLALAVACSRQDKTSKDLRVTVLLRDASGLSSGDDVRLGNLRVGEIKKIKESKERFEVQVVVQSHYRKSVTQDAEFELEKESVFSKHRYLELVPGEGDAAPDGAQFVGSSRVGIRMPDWVTETRDALKSPEIRDRWREFTEAVEKAASRGKEEWKQNKPMLEQKAKDLYEMVRKEAPELASRIKKEMERLIREIEEHFSS